MVFRTDQSRTDQSIVHPSPPAVGHVLTFSPTPVKRDSLKIRKLSFWLPHLFNQMRNKQGMMQSSLPNQETTCTRKQFKDSHK
ncbi:MAG: hypothetical protein CMM01_01005 [Rhodopirellula sp.]|nr:hypothetical protein [Rhodopirellula sp.]